MPIRFTGMNSGLQTDLIIQELVKGQKAKVDNAKKVHTAFQWKQDAWKELNTKALKLHKMIDSMRWSDAFVKKTSKVSNTAKASVVTGDTAVKGVQELQVNELAKTAYLTGGKITAASGENTKLSALTGGPANDNDTISLTVNSGGKDQKIELTGASTIKDVVNQLKNAGLNASFDANNGRFFISSKTMGASGDFTITADNENGFKALSALRINDQKTNMAVYEKLAAIGEFDGNGDFVLKKPGEYEELIKSFTDSRIAADKASLKSTNDALAVIDKRIDTKLSAYRDYLADPARGNLDPTDVANMTTKQVMDKMQSISDDNKKALGDAEKDLKDYYDNVAANPGLADPDVEKALKDAITAEKEKQKDFTALKFDDYNAAAYEKDMTTIFGELKTDGSGDREGGGLEDKKSELETQLTPPNASDPDSVRDNYRAEAEKQVEDDIKFAHEALSKPIDSAPDPLTRIKGQDAKITLNGAEFTSNTNTFTINGLTINAIQKTDPGETITITTEDDTQGIYDTIKNFIKEYNALINEMDRLYNADSNRDYKPLTEEEKEAMSEKEIEEWEKKIKDSVLRRDSSLFDISNVMKNAMMSGVKVNGKDKEMHLSDFGIEALSYFLAGKNEKNAYYISGDPDSLQTAGKDDKLKEWIAKDAQTVTDFFTGLSKNLFAEMDKIIMKSDNFKSFNSLYNDKQYKTDLIKYNNEIAKQEAKLTKMEDKFYKQYTAMEVAMAKMQSNQSALSGLLGM